MALSSVRGDSGRILGKTTNLHSGSALEGEVGEPPSLEASKKRVEVAPRVMAIGMMVGLDRLSGLFQL